MKQLVNDKRQEVSNIEDDLIIEFCQQNGINPESGLGWMRKMIVENSLAFEAFINLKQLVNDKKQESSNMRTEDDLMIEFCQQHGINPESGLGWMRKIIVESSLAFEAFINLKQLVNDKKQESSNMRTEDDLIIEFCQQHGINPKSGLGWMRKIIVKNSLTFETFINNAGLHKAAA